MLSWIFEKETPESDKMKAENERVSAELAILAQQLESQAQMDEHDAAAHQRFMDRIRKEGRG